MHVQMVCLFSLGLLLTNSVQAFENPALSAEMSPPVEALAPLTAAQAGVQVVTVAGGLEHPWGLAFLPDGRMLVTERPGRLRIVQTNGTVSPPVTGVPTVMARGQGGLLDVAVDPNFATNSYIYFSYAEADQQGQSGTAVARAKLSGTALTNLQVIFRQFPKVFSDNHYGSRLAFKPVTNLSQPYVLFISLGDRSSYRDWAQDLSTSFGKVVRIFPDGTIPPNNPYAGQPGVRPEIWSYGHRNPQGLTLNKATGHIWLNEHGPLGGDELNIVRSRGNFGWPVITYGREYGSGTPIGEGTDRADVVRPSRYWVPVSIAPSGLSFLTSDRYPGWTGNLFMGAMADRHLVRLIMNKLAVRSEQRLLTDLGERIRDVREGPDGYLYLLTDNFNGRILKLLPTN